MDCLELYKYCLNIFQECLHKCPLCDMSFDQRNTLRAHLLSHSVTRTHPDDVTTHHDFTSPGHVMPPNTEIQMISQSHDSGSKKSVCRRVSPQNIINIEPTDEESEVEVSSSQDKED